MARKGLLYKKIKKETERIFNEYCLDFNIFRSNYRLERIINKIIDENIDYYWDEILESPDYDYIKSEKKLEEAVFDTLYNDIFWEDLTADYDNYEYYGYI